MGYQNSSRHVSGMQVTDRPEGPMDFSVFASLSSMTPDAQKAAHMAGRRRALLERQGGGASELVLRDAAGKPRLVLSVAADGGARKSFKDETGRAAREVTPKG